MTDALEPPRRHLPIRQDWLALRSEEAIEPDLPIVDAHHHLWDKDEGRYLLRDFAADLSSGHDIAATVFIECHTAYHQHAPEHIRSLGETEFAAQQAAMSDAAQPGATRIAAAIVGNVDLRLGDRVEPALEAHAAASEGRFRGVRNTSAWHADPAARGSLLSPPPGLLKDHSFHEGVRRLARQNLSFDAWMYHTQLPEAVELAAACPDTTIILNHAGGPIGIGPYAGRRNEVFQAWRKDIRELAHRPNVFAKLGGFGMRLFGFDVHARDLPPTSDDLARAWAPYIEESIDAFGPARCMFESNFPVDKGSCSYVALWNAYKKVTAGCTAAEKSLLFHGTAERVYRTGIRD